jgi:hypothetical protein
MKEWMGLIILVLFLVGCSYKGWLNFKTNPLPIEQQVAGNIVEVIQIIDHEYPDKLIKKKTIDIFSVLGDKLGSLEDNKLDIDEIFKEIAQVQGIDRWMLDRCKNLIVNNIGKIEVELEGDPSVVTEKMRDVIKIVLMELNSDSL